MGYPFFCLSPAGLTRGSIHQNSLSMDRRVKPGDDTSELGGFRRQLLALLDRLFDGADHVEGGFRQMIILAFAEAAETLDGVREVDELAGRAGEDFGNVERLRQEALDLAGAGHRQLVLFRKLVHAENGDDVLER